VSKHALRLTLFQFENNAALLLVDSKQLRRELEAKAQVHDPHTGRYVGGGGTAASAAATYNAMDMYQKADYLTEKYGAWAASLTDGEKSAIHTYTSGKFDRMNKALRTDSVEASGWGNEIKACGAALMRGKTPHAMTVTRGVSGSSQAMAALWEIATHQENRGKTFTDKGFGSTEVSGIFTYGGSFRLTIHLPKGAPGGYVDSISANQGEREFLLPPYCHFIIKSAHVDAKGKQHVELEFLKCTWLEGKFMSMGRTEEKAKQAIESATDDKTQVMSPKFCMDVRGIVFDDPELQAVWAKALSDSEEE